MSVDPIFGALQDGTSFLGTENARQMLRFKKASGLEVASKSTSAIGASVGTLDFFGCDAETKPAASPESATSARSLNTAQTDKPKKTKKKRSKTKKKRKNSQSDSMVSVFGQPAGNVDTQTNVTDESCDDEQMTKSRMAEIKAFRKRMRITVKGNDVPNPIERFDQIPAPPAGSTISTGSHSHIMGVLLRNIDNRQYKEPTPVQMQSLPILIAGRDALVAAPTGSGKTAAFALPILTILRGPLRHTKESVAQEKPKKKKKKKKKKAKSKKALANNYDGGVRALVLSPTRELAAQIYREFVALSSGKKFRIVLMAKSNMASVIARCKPQHASAVKAKVGALMRGIDVVVSTPQRLQHMVAQHPDIPFFQNLEFFVLDEADKLFELGFVEQIDSVIAHIDKHILSSKRSGRRCVRGMFSATLPEGVESMANSVLQNPIRVVVGTRNAGASSIDQSLVFVGKEEGKLLAIRQLLAKGLTPPVIIFVQSKVRATEVFKELVYEGFSVDVLSADRTQAQRDRIVDNFRTGQLWVLIATDLVARGMDFKGVNTVINFDLPSSPITYIHRIGRTGRAGRSGRAITFFTEADMFMLRSIANVVKLSGCDVPDWMMQLKRPKQQERKRLRSHAPERYSVSTRSVYDKKKSAHKRNMVRQSKRRKRNLHNADPQNNDKNSGV